MARIELKGIAHSYAAKPGMAQDYALRELNHVWEDGGAYALLGPSGCGKTTLLNIISGLLRPSQGQVLFDTVDVTTRSPERRNIAQVFQFPVVYDTMTAYDNLALPLRNRGTAENVVRQRVGQVAEMLGLQQSLGRRAEDKQLISMGRGLVRADVAAVLFDEPLTVIDPQLKCQLRRKLREVHQQLGLTLVYVTHDQTEALTFADQVAVMYEGQVVQLGTPQVLFEQPEHTFVGYFIGSPGMNVLDCRIADGAAWVADQPIALSAGLAARAGTGTRLQLGIRPECLRFAAAAAEAGVPVEVTDVENRGSYQLVGVALGTQRLLVKLAEDQQAPSESARLVFPPQWTRLYADGHLVG